MHLCSGFTRAMKSLRFLTNSWICRILISCLSIFGVLDGSRWLVTSRRKIKLRQKNITHTLPISSDEKLARHPDNRLASGWQDGSSYQPHFLSTSVYISTSMMLQIEGTGRLATGAINSEFTWCRLKCCPNQTLASSWITATIDRKHGSNFPPIHTHPTNLCVIRDLSSAPFHYLSCHSSQVLVIPALLDTNGIMA